MQTKKRHTGLEEAPKSAKEKKRGAVSVTQEGPMPRGDWNVYRNDAEQYDPGSKQVSGHRKGHTCGTSRFIRDLRKRITSRGRSPAPVPSGVIIRTDKIDEQKLGAEALSGKHDALA
jgi:hypothetical protein